MTQPKPLVDAAPYILEAAFQAGFEAGRKAVIAERCPHGFLFLPCRYCPPSLPPTPQVEDDDAIMRFALDTAPTVRSAEG